MKESIQRLNSYIPEEPLEKVKQKYNLTHLVRLSANENPFGTSPTVKDAVVKWSFEESNRYPDSYASELRDLIVKKTGVPKEQLVFGSGLDEILELLSRTFLEKDDEILVAEPTFSEYALHAKIEGAKVVNIPVLADTGHYDLDKFLDNITTKTKLIWLCNPNNPTGVYESKKNIRDFIEQVPKTALVLIDEAYIDYVTDESIPTNFELLSQFENVAVLRTFSKVYGLANYRVGYIAMAPKLAEYLQTIRLPYNLNSLAQTAAISAFKDQKFVQYSVQKNAEEREKWEEFLQVNGIKFFHSQANFIYFKYFDADKLADKLLQNGFQVRRGLQKNWLRVTIGKNSDNVAIQKIIASDLNR